MVVKRCTDGSEERVHKSFMGEVLFVIDLLTQPHLKRMVLNVPVTSLHTVLAALERKGVMLEHLYDYSWKWPVLPQSRVNTFQRRC
jgi:hypothetical protein